MVGRVLGSKSPSKHGDVVPKRAEYAAGYKDLDEDLTNVGLSGKCLFDGSVNEGDAKARPNGAQNRRTVETVLVQTRKGGRNFVGRANTL